MSLLEAASVQCPYCWETLEVSVDPSVSDQEYVEDCQVCCQPILIHAVFDHDHQLDVSAMPENE